MGNIDWLKRAGFALAFALVGSAAIGAGSQEPGQAFKKDYVRPTAVPFPASNPYTQEKAQLGEALFFDPRLSGSNYISCASCHNPAMSWGDGLPRGIGHGMTVLGRRTPTVLNTAWADLLMWDGRKESLEDQALGPIGADVEMNQKVENLVPKLSAIREYRTMFNIAFPGEGITLDNIAKAIATYERTIVSGTAPFDKWIAGDRNAISESAKRGFALFNTKANCAACHSGWNFTDGSFHDIGLKSDDIGRGKYVPVERMKHAFKTPTLRDVARRAPYMHDGSVNDLAAVVEHYDSGFVQRPSLSGDIKRLNLTAEEKRDLIEFMLTLTGDNPPVRIPVLPASEQLATQAADE